MNNKYPGIRRTILSSTILVGGLLGSAVGHAAVLDFEDAMRGQIIDDEYVEDGVRISAYNRRVDGDGLAVIFDTRVKRGPDGDLKGPFTKVGDGPDEDNEPYDPGNVLIIQSEKHNVCADPASGFCETPDDEGHGGAFFFDFAAPVTLWSIDFFDIEDSEDHGNPDSEILLYGADDTLLASFYVPATGGDNTWDTFYFDGVSDVTRLVVELAGSGAIDNLSYAVVPVPAAVWLFGSGLLGLLGVTVRHKRAA